MAALTADDLVTKTLLRCFWKASTAPLSSAEILSLADEVIAGELWPMVVASGGDYYLSYEDHAVTAAQIKYRLPAKAYGPIRDVLDVLDTTDVDDRGKSIPMIDIEELGRTNRLGPNDSRFFHYFEGDSIGLWPTPDTTEGTLRVRFYRHPNQLALLAACGVISARANVTLFGVHYDQLTYSGADLSSGVGNANVAVDTIGTGNAHQQMAAFAAANAILNTTTASVLSSLTPGWGDTAVGDYIALAGYTPVVQLPDFMHPLLIRLTAAACLRAHGENDAADRENQAASLLYERAVTTAMPRSEAEPQIVVTRNSPLRAARRIWR